MHTTALEIGGAFLDAYKRPGGLVVDVGSYDVNGSLRSVCPPEMRYLGLDLEEGPGVDLVVEHEKPFPLPEGGADLVVSSSAFEHDSAFWVSFLELVRITKPGGLIYINVPSNGHVHSHPYDCWRFYPDAGVSLERWANREKRPVTLVESFIAERRGEFWNDFVAVFVRGKVAELRREPPWLSDRFPCTNVRRLGSETVLKPRKQTEDQVLLAKALAENRQLRAEIQRLAQA
jgi:SAM-dependent methyltransferase